jgi:predicted secreted Zn-dependent protease
MSCSQLCRKGLTKVWLSSEDGKTEIMKEILRKLGYKNVQSKALIPGENERSIIGNYKEGKTNYGVFIDYFSKEKNEHIEISASENRAKEIEENIKAIYPRIDCKLRNSCLSEK